jgi:rhodanese-related sulfurtransferase
MKNGRPVIVILLAVAAISAMPTELLANDHCLNIPIELAIRNTRRRSVEHTITAARVLGRIKNRQETMLVDVRGAGEFEQFRIPGSINVPLHAVKTKPFLKVGPFILFDEGYRHELLANECSTLAGSGFPCSVLYGGLTAWRDERGDLEGEHAAWGKLGSMTAALFFHERNMEGWVMIDASQQRSLVSVCLMPDAAHVPFTAAPAQFASRLIERLRPRRADVFTRILIFNEKGAGYDSIRLYAGKAALRSLYFLEGGIEQYAAYLTQQTLLALPRGERLKTADGCGSVCGGKR